MPSIEQLALYYTYATVGLTAAHKLVEVARGLVIYTPSSVDDEIVKRLDDWLKVADQLLGFFALRLGKR